LYEYFKEDININEEDDDELPPGFMDLAYQRQAVVSAKKVLDAYGGVFLADVVGLGKTFISALLLQQLPGRKLIVCPPVLMNYWRETLNQFYVPGVEVVSLGKLREVRERGTDKYRVVLVDEAHRFRNELTQGYEDLHAICRGKQVVLVSATPLNNKLADILAQLKLFQPGRKSSVPGVPNLERFFGDLQRQLDGFDKSDPAYLDAVKETAARVRDRVLKHVMVRRTRTEIMRYFSEDLERQGLTFPKMGEPQRIVYSFDEATNDVFNNTVELLKAFSYARYTPLLYLKAALGEFEQQSQRNIGGFMKGLLVKRLESSFFAFKNTLRRFVRSYEQFIGMLRGGVVYISKDVDVFELLDAEDEEKLQFLVDQERAQKYDSSRFKPDLLSRLEEDLRILTTLLSMWEGVTQDPKLEGFIYDLRTHPLLKDRKLVIFSESKETAEYLYAQLEMHFPGEVMSYASGGGAWNAQGYSVKVARDLIEANYDPRAEGQSDNIRLLITTDVLAEGINLHRSNVVVNYDLPWNPTRVLQRVGRVNRVGTAFEEVFVFNFFPTAESDAHLGLEDNIKAKLQAFHNTLGEDAKYLSADEEVSTHELFGDRLFRKLSDRETYEGDATEGNGEESELKYLLVIRKVRDDVPDVFERIKRLPKKARGGRAETTLDAPETLLTFFRKGKLKRFTLAQPGEAAELTFLDTAKRFECAPETPKSPIPPSYYELLESSKRHLETLEQGDPLTGSRRGGSNETFILGVLKSREVRGFKGFTDEDERYLKLVREGLEAGLIPKNTTKTLKAALNGNLEPLKLLGVLKRHLSERDVTPVQEAEEEASPRDVILSLYLRRNG
jgi:superfamily II DNA/RNA helicase